MLTCERAAAVLRGLETGALACEPEEIEEILALGLAIEADPEELGMLGWVQPVVREHAECEIDAPTAASALEAWLADTNEALASDWYRITTSKAEIATREGDKMQVRRALGVLRDARLVAKLVRLVAALRQAVPSGRWVVCAELGVEQYALTVKGQRVARALEVRLARFAQAGFKAFVAAFDKADQKMRAFGGEVATLSQHIGHVRKNREQVIIGLAKAGGSTQHALGAFHAAMAQVRAPDVAVTCARNAAAFGGPVQAANRLAVAQNALLRAGYPNAPIVMGAAKSLLAFDPPDAGIPRFSALMQGLDQLLGRSELLYKYTVRLMPAAHEPARVIQRVARAGHLLNQLPSRVARPPDHRACAVALAAMVDSRKALEPLIVRYRELELGLVNRGVSHPLVVESDALECLACPGTPPEVVDTVATLVEQLARGRAPERGDVAIAASFAKRFAY